MRRLPDNALVRIFRHLGNRFVVHSVGMESAALSFYLIFAIFPFLIFVSALLSFFQLNLDDFSQYLGSLLPGDVERILDRFLLYARGRPNARLLLSSLVFSLYYPMRAANSLMLSVRKAYHLGAPQGALSQLLKTLLYTVLLMLTVILTVVLMTVSNRILDFAVKNLLLPEFVADWWAALRFPVAAVAAYFAIYVLYALAQDRPRNWRYLWPGTLAALGGWMLVSWLYALYVNNIAHYSLLYGSIGTVICLLIWLNLSSLLLILGAELNGALMSRRRSRAEPSSEKGEP